MTAFSRLWTRAPAWRAILMAGVFLTGLAIIYPPSIQSRTPTMPSATYTAAPVAPVAPPLVQAAPDQPAATPSADSAIPAFGTVLTDTLTIVGRTIPLPAGEWRVVAAMRGRMKDGLPFGTAMLAQTANGALTGAIIVEAMSPIPSSHQGYPANPACQSNLIIFGRVLSVADHGVQACWEVEPLMLGKWDKPGNSGLVQSGVADLQQRGVSLPPVLLRALFFDADLDHWISMDIMKPAPSPSEAPFGWNNNEVLQTPEKRARAARMRDWASGWYKVFHLGFTGALKAGDLTPVLSTLPN